MAAHNTTDSPTSDERLHRPRAVEVRLAISARMLDRLVDEGQLDVVLVGTHRRITESSILRYLDQHRRP